MTTEEMDLVQAEQTAQQVVLPGRGLWRDAARETFRKKSAIVGAVLLGLLVFVALFAPFIAPYDPIDPLIGEGSSVEVRDGPSWDHPMGIDGNGRDEFSRVLYGARISLGASLAAVTVAVLIGTMIGLVAGYYGGWLDNVFMRFMDVFLAFPALLLAIVIVTVDPVELFGLAGFVPSGTERLLNAIIAIAVVTIPIYARVVRSRVLSVREQDFVTADLALGVSHRRILWHRILPNSLTPLVVQSTLGIATAVLEIAALSFLGLGIVPPDPEWGSMLEAERSQVFTSPHLVFFPGLMIMLNVLAFNLIGDGLRDALDPRLNR